MTYLLTCLLCAGEVALPGAADGPLVPPRPERFLSSEGLRVRDDVGDATPARLALAQHSPDGDHSGGDGGAHVGPMWIMMGAVMVGMMVVLGASMMRGHRAAPARASGLGSPPELAIPTASPFRPGG